MSNSARVAIRPSFAALPLMHATTVADVPAGKEWIFELKWDGVRALVLRAGGVVEIRARTGTVVTARYPEVAEALAGLAGGDFALDGEIVALDERGAPSFERLQERMHLGSARAARAAAMRAPVVVYLFDCLVLEGQDLRALPLRARKRLLERLLPRTGPLRFCAHVAGPGGRFLAVVRAAGLEGMVAKRATSPYRGGRSLDWRKIKCTLQQEFVIGGWTKPRGSRPHLGALHLGVYDHGELVYAGRVGSGLSEGVLRQLVRRLRALGAGASPFTRGAPPRGPEHHWVRPELVCEVRFAAWTSDGLLRQPVFLGLRSDKPPAAVRREVPRPRS
jgi:DNA ligase D-like protein (predicted ligase)